jgi:Tol biopolymer transport system component/surface antigen
VIAALVCVAALLAAIGAPTRAAAAPRAAPYVALELIANGGGDRLDVVVRVRTARPRIKCDGTAKQAGRSARLPRMRTGVRGGAQWHWYVGDGAPRAKLKIRVSCSFPNGKVRRRGIARTVGPGPFQRRAFDALVKPDSLRKEKWAPEKKHDGSGGGSDLYPRGQCTWYVAKRRPDLPYFPGTAGDAKNWIEAAQENRIPTGTQPRAGAVAVFRPGQYGAGYYGHVAYVISADSETITVREANYRRRPIGSRRTLPRRGIRFIYQVGDDVPTPTPAPTSASSLPSPLFPRVLPSVATLLVSDATGVAGAADNGEARDPAVSSDGRYVTFTSSGSNLDPADVDPTRDVFVRDLQAGTTTLVSRATGGAKANGHSFGPVISRDGRYVSFSSSASNLDQADSDMARDVFVRDLQAGTTTLVSRATEGAKGNGGSFSPALSGDGRFVTFESDASNLDPADEDTTMDVFVRDLQAGTTQLVSRASGASGGTANASSISPAISGSGRYVTFESNASDLVLADEDHTPDVFVRDLHEATTTLVSRPTGSSNTADAGSHNPAISDDGRYVTFDSNASNLDSADVDTGSDVFVRDLQAATTTLVSRASGVAGPKGNGGSFNPMISGDGRHVSFDSTASNLDSADVDTGSDVFVREWKDREAPTRLISRATGVSGAKGNQNSSSPAISGDGGYVAFVSSASNLDPAEGRNVFVRAVQLTTTTLVNRATGTVGMKDKSSDAMISNDGRYVAFTSSTSKLDPADPDSSPDVFVRDLQAGTTTLVSRATDSAKGNGNSFGPAISGDGRYVTFESTASNLDDADNDPIRDVFVRDLQAATTTLVSRATDSAKGNGNSFGPAISGDGRYVSFESNASNLDPADDDTGRDVFVRDLLTGATVLVSRASGPSGPKGDGYSRTPSISGDGRYVTFDSSASNLDSADPDTAIDVFVRDLQAGTTTLVSRARDGTKGNRGSFSPVISGDARFVTFESSASNLDLADGDFAMDVFVRDLQVGTTMLISRASGASGAKGNGGSFSPSISADGRYVTFTSDASNLDLADGDNVSDVFLRGDLRAPTSLGP